MSLVEFVAWCMAVQATVSFALWWAVRRELAEMHRLYRECRASLYVLESEASRRHTAATIIRSPGHRQTGGSPAGDRGGLPGGAQDGADHDSQELGGGR